MKVLLKPSNGLAAVGHENHLLVLFHALRFHQLPQPAARFVVVGLNEPETLGLRCLVLGLAPKCHDALAGDHFEPPFFVSCSDVAAIDSHRYRAVGQSLLFPVLLRTIE